MPSTFWFFFDTSERIEALKAIREFWHLADPSGPPFGSPSELDQPEFWAQELTHGAFRTRLVPERHQLTVFLTIYSRYRKFTSAEVELLRQIPSLLIRLENPDRHSKE